MFESKYGAITAEKTKFLDREPLFVLRAKDRLATQTVRYYARVCCFLGITTTNQGLIAIGERAKLIAAEMAEWQRENKEKVRLPD
jgi:hypothetical protein